MVGGVLGAGACTVTLKLLLAVRLPSLTVMVINAVPVWPAAGVTVTVRFAPLPPRTMFAVGTRVVEEEVFVRVRFAAEVCASPIVNGIAAVAWPEVTVCAPIEEMVGAVLVGTEAWTVSVNALLVVFVPSLTETVMSAAPFRPAAGVTVTVRLDPEPPKTICEFGTSVVSEELPETVRLPAGVSASATVKASAGVD